ncbi:MULTISPECIES: serine hydrolase domain-containing protein [unclassified Pseudomonas]|uniref:serine hydrolase domain-containing protein n=1 Tax=unclassified Pseudomonas TaxID=196821 RepID=UPI0021C73591|nr:MULTISPECIES: serine hydrolase [unclassified Pseudomonas]MCU1735034.1 beta-lactamase family protein [Pseudomonas sp. 20P_3.2_Bac4]MCU1743509.1 beta-lactamase family protein [Pseudomonas sp. 20P_3.2_Bac5]
MNTDFVEAMRRAYRTSAPSVAPLMEGFPPPAAQRVTWHNFMTPPHNRWAFHNLGRIRPSISVPRGQAATGPLPAAGYSIADFSFLSASGDDVSLADHLAATHTDGWLVMKDGQVAQELYANGHGETTRHIMFSVTKSLIGMKAEELVQNGQLDDQRLAAHYVAEFEGSAFGDASVRQLMDMAVSIDYDEVYDDPDSGSSHFGYACGLTPPPAGIQACQSLYEYLPGMRKRGEHGGFFHYVTATTEALGWVMERATGRSCAELLGDIWQGLGCERDGFFLADPWGRNITGCGFNATLRDMARYGSLLLDRGHCQGRQLLSADAIGAVLAGGDPAIYAANESFAQWSPGASYKSQWYVYPGEALLAVGIHGQYLYLDFERRVVIVKQSSMPVAESILDIDTVRLLRALVRAL